MFLRPALAAALAAAALTGLGAGPALADTANHNSCFLSSNWEGWKSPDPSTIYLRVTMNRIFRLDLAHPANDLNDPSVHLVTTIRGSSWICSPLDLSQFSVADNHGLREPLFVRRITELTPEEAKAIPRQYRP